jgi:hypothetical protein
MALQYRVDLYSPSFGRFRCPEDGLPEGMEGFTVELNRSPQWHGVATEFALDLKFVKGARKFLLQCRSKAGGLEAEVYMIVYTRRGSAEAWKQFTISQIDFSKWEVSETVAVTNIVNQQFLQRVLNRLENPVSFNATESLSGTPIVPPSAVSVALKGKTIAKETRQQVKGEVTPLSEILVTNPSRDIYGLCDFGEAIVSEFPGSAQYGNILFRSRPELTPSFICQEAGTYNIDINLIMKMWVNLTRVYPPNQNEIKLVIEHNGIRSEFGNLFGQGWVYFSQSEMFNQATGEWRRTFQFTGSKQLELAVNDEVYIYINYTYQSETHRAVFTTLQDSTLRIYGLTATPGSDANGYPVHEVLNQTLSAYGDVADVLKSDYYGRTDLGYEANGEGAHRLITNGYQIRGFQEKIPSIKGKDLLESLAAIDNIGLGLEWEGDSPKLRVEPKKHFYRPEVLFTLPAVQDLKVVSDTNAYYNLLELGYRQYENSGINTLDEFNTKREWGLPFTRTEKKSSKLSAIRADAYGIELARRKPQSDFPTEGTTYDEQLFFLAAKENWEIEYGDSFDTVSGLIDPATACNISLSPRHMLLSHYEDIAALLVYSQKGVSFRGGEINNELEVNSQLEKSGIEKEELPQPYYYPELYQLKSYLTDEQWQQLKEDPYGLIEFPDSYGNLKRGFLLNAKYTPFTTEIDFTLLRFFE